MFRRVGLRLAALNAVVVIAVIALAGATIYLSLLRSLDAEVDNALKARVEAVADRPGVLNAVSTPGPGGTTSESDHERDDDELSSGDTIILGVTSDGQGVYNPRGITLDGIPVAAGIEQALRGQVDKRSVSISHIGLVRVLTVPVVDQGRVIGAVQGLQGLSEHQAELAAVRLMTLLGAGLGVLIAVPAGWFLARRAMRPINAAFERRRTFVADASHELRTPLTLIRANAEIAQQDATAPIASIMPELGSILEEVDRTDRLVDDLLTLARADAGRLALRRASVDLGDVVDSATESMRPLADARGVRLSMSVHGACVASVDEERIRQVIRILLDNALKHTPAGGTVDVDIGPSPRHVTVSVRDTGVGIAPEDVPHVFDRFYRVDKARARAEGGTGLGLPIAKALVEAHGGQITLMSTVGEGTVVSFTLPGEVRGPAPAREPAKTLG